MNIHLVGLVAGLSLLGWACQSSALAANDINSSHSVNLMVHHGYFSGLPVLVRVELWNAYGVERELWAADALLSVDNPEVTLSTNRVLLRNGLGSALVDFHGNSDFVLTAAIGPLQAKQPLVSLAAASTTAVGGSLTGSNVWSGVVRVTNDVTIRSGASLVIQSNTLVLIDGVANGTNANDIIVNGRMEALGTESHPVTITCNNTNSSFRWGQIRHDSAQPSIYRYTSITRGGRAFGEGHTSTGPVIRPIKSKIRFDNCNITDHAEPASGMPGKIAQASGSDLAFTGCLFQRARMGPEIIDTALACANTWIMDMDGPDDADGIYLCGQSAGQLITLSGCVVADGDDDGIDTLDPTVTIENCIIRDWNNQFEDAKGISVFNGAVTLRRSLIVDSTVGISAKWSYGAPALVIVDHCTLTRNQTNVLANWKYNAPGPFVDYRITNSILWGKDSVHSDFSPTNFSIGFCALSEPWPGDGNINADPLFVNAETHDFHLQPDSPCVDSGSSYSPLDADGSPTDMGWALFVPPAPRVSCIRHNNGEIHFVLDACSNRNYIVEFCTNLVSGWSILRTNFQASTTSPIQDNIAGQHRFYRARWP